VCGRLFGMETINKPYNKKIKVCLECRPKVMLDRQVEGRKNIMKRRVASVKIRMKYTSNI
jgi:hypothetical protein